MSVAAEAVRLPARIVSAGTGYDNGVPDYGNRGDDSRTADEEDVRGLAEPETLVDGADDLGDEADLGSRLSMAASDPPSSWAGPDVPPENKAR